MSDAYSVLWFVFQPLLFGLIGTEIRIDALRADTVALGLLVLAIGEGGGYWGGVRIDALRADTVALGLLVLAIGEGGRVLGGG